MTNERAVEILNLDLDILGQYGGETAEAYKMAIQALDAQPCEDCISREAVIILIDEASEMHPYKVVGDSDTYSNYNQGWSDACDWLYANIEGVPSVTPQRKRGKWIVISCEPTDIFKCSECGMRVINPYKYCHNCGAEMEGEE